MNQRFQTIKYKGMCLPLPVAADIGVIWVETQRTGGERKERGQQRNWWPHPSL